MIELRAAPGEGATVAELVRYMAYLREQIMYLEDLREKQMAKLVAAAAAANTEG